MVGVVFYMKDILGLGVPLDPQGQIERVVYNARMLGATHIFLIDETVFQLSRFYQHSDGEIAFEAFWTLGELEHEYSDETFIYLENIETILKNNIESFVCLTEFEHPDDGVYVVGADFGGIRTEGRENREWVYCPFEDMWAEHVLTVVLYDRLQKVL